MCDTAPDVVAPAAAAALAAREKWELKPTVPWFLQGEQLLVAQHRRELGNVEMRAQRPVEAFELYKKALFMVEFEEDFQEDSEEERELPDLQEVHAERLRCLSNLAAASLAALEETGQEPSVEGYAGKAKRYAHRGLQLRKDEPKLWFRKGKAELLLGEIASAASTLTEAARLAPQDPNIRKLLQEARVACAAERSAQRHVEHAMGAGAAEVAGAERRNEPKPKKQFASEEERKAEIEYNKRQLLYHFEKAKVERKSESEEDEESPER
ncbi:unnamed protein product [Durusdinium trenchii]|uniref:Peptidylprolyl isomerase n=1 Tax=Durusdinium trenchii TaxID=1381693 RepID=A0ABP0Q705_9DINO